MKLLELPVKAEHAAIHAAKAASGKAVSWLRDKAGMAAKGAADAEKSLAGKIGGGITKVGSFAAKGYFATWVACNKAVEAVARARGLTPGDAARVKSICSCYDAIACKAVALGFEHHGMKGAAFASSFIPTASVAYLAYSTARNPIKVTKAAAAGVKSLASKLSGRRDDTGALKIRARSGVAGSPAVSPSDAVTLIADAIKAHAGDDWFFAILPWALEASDSTAEAIDLAENVHAATPAPKDE